MSTGYYPVMLDLHGRRAVVVGGGTVAETKVGPLVDAGAAVDGRGAGAHAGARAPGAGGGAHAPAAGVRGR